MARKMSNVISAKSPMTKEKLVRNKPALLYVSQQCHALRACLKKHQEWSTCLVSSSLCFHRAGGAGISRESVTSDTGSGCIQNTRFLVQIQDLVRRVQTPPPQISEVQSGGRRDPTHDKKDFFAQQGRLSGSRAHCIARASGGTHRRRQQ